MINTTFTSTRRIAWIAAAAAAFVGAAVLYDARPGLNWVLWIVAASTAVIASRRVGHGAVERPLLILLGWATLLALGITITADARFQVLSIASIAMLLGLAVVTIGAAAWRSLSVILLPTVPFLAPARVLQATVGELALVPKNISALRSRPVLRGLIVAIPLAVVVLALLRDADPTIAWVWTNLSQLIPDWSLSGRVVFFAFLLILTLGASSIAAHEHSPRLPGLPRASTRTSIGATEQQTILITLGVVLWLFVILQVSYLFHSPPSVVGSGVTFSDYARKGFAELTVAVTLVGAVLVILQKMRAVELPARTASRLVALETALLVALELILISAFRRVVLYEQAYGFTTARLYAQAYMVAMAIGLVAFYIEIRGERVSVDLGRRLAVIALGTFTVLLFWNHEAWIVNRNFDRLHETGKFDTRYLDDLSANAVPAVIARAAELPAVQRPDAEQWAACVLPARDLRWYEFNVRTTAAQNSVRAGGFRCLNRRRHRD